MTLPLSLFIGLRFTRSRRHKIILSLISMISTVSIALSVTVLIVSSSAMNGFERELNSRILAVVPHGEIEPINQPWKNWNDILRKIEELPGISAAPYINFTGLVTNKPNLCAIQIRGINPKQEGRLGILPKFVKNDAWINFKAGKQQIIIGKGIADVLHVKQGDWVSVMILSIDSTRDHRIQQPKHVRLYVSGIFQLDSCLDHSLALVPIEDASQYLNMGDSVTGISLKMNDAFNANKLLRDVGKIIDCFVYIRSWIDIYGYIYRDIKTVRSIVYLAMILMMGIACFNIVSTLTTAVKNRSKDIAILRLIGTERSLIHAIFVWYGLLVGIRGGLYGTIAGIIISLNLTSIFSYIEELIGHQFLNSSIYFIDFLPSELHYRDVFYVVIATFLLSFLASWYPARRAVRINLAVVLND